MTHAEGKIFGIGLSRTGTLSLASALGLLGFEARHYPDDPVTQAELKHGRYRLSVLETVDALLDIPVAPYFAQLDTAFPGSRFILTTRPTEPWLLSVEKHFDNYVEQRRDPFDDFTIAATYGLLHFSAERFRYVKSLHETNVRAYFSGRDDLLVFDLSSGDSWGELCAFLGRPVPAEPFPHVNRARQRPASRRPRGRFRRFGSLLRG
jgi:hypothetical protein